jgi:queuine tRNA-ribosyltransferase
MAFDECAPGNSDWNYARAAMNRTHRWAKRSVEQVEKNNKIRKKDGRHQQALFPIVQ